MEDAELGIAPIYHGEKLKDAVETATDERVALIEGFLYAEGCVMVFADDGLGKSSCLLCAMVEASSGANVFNALPCPKPLKIIWLCAERPLNEPFERIKLMSGKLKPNFNNLVFDKELQGMDLRDKSGQADFMLRLIELSSVFPDCKPDIVVIDPIYAMIGAGDLSSPTDAGLVNHIVRNIQSRYECAVIYTHHTNRGGRHEGKRVEGDMYGSRFLSANLTGQFHLKKTDDGIELNCTKNTYGNLLSHIPLVYDELTQTLSMSAESADLNKRDKILIFLRKKFLEKKEFTLREISNQMKVSDAYIRKSIKPFVLTGHIVNKSSSGTKAVYFMEKNV